MRVLIVLLFTSLVSLGAHAGSVLKLDAKDSAGKAVPNQVYYAQDGMLRIDRVDAGGTVVSYTLIRDGAIWEVNPRERTFTRVDSASLKQMMSGEEAQMQAMIARLPPEKQAAMQARMAQMKQHAAATEYTFSDTGRSDHSGQYSCKVWEEQRNSKPFAEYCVVPAASLPAGGELETAIKKAVATTNQMLASVPQLAKQAEHITILGKMGGFPVSSRIGQGTEHVLSSAQAQALPADKFAIPQGFAEKPLGQNGGD